MLNHGAEESFRRGRHSLSHGRMLEALALFESAIEMERRNGSHRIQARYLSYYGLCLALETKQVRQGAYFCREAVQQEGFDPELYLNLARVLLFADRRRDAYDAIRVGLELEADHRELVRLKTKMGQRRKPILPFLSRSNPLNVALGRAFSV